MTETMWTTDCIVCDAKRQKEQAAAGTFTPGDDTFGRRIIVCPDCGYKRCPKATFHELACTGSDLEGQPGSLFGPRELWPEGIA